MSLFCSFMEKCRLVPGQKCMNVFETIRETSVPELYFTKFVRL